MAKKKKKEKEKKEPKKRGGNHPKHPKCQCGRALYKTLEKGKASRKDDPWRYCRNENCELYGKDQSEKLDDREAILIKREGGKTTVITSFGLSDVEEALNEVRYDDRMPG